MPTFIKFKTEFLFKEKGEEKIHLFSRYINLDQLRTVRYNHDENIVYLYFLNGDKEILKGKDAEAFDEQMTYFYLLSGGN